jgi:hypothetical protein
MSSLRLVHPKREATRAEARSVLAEEPFDVGETSASSLRLHSMVEKLYKLDGDTNALDVFDQLVDDLLAEARGEGKPQA